MRLSLPKTGAGNDTIGLQGAASVVYAGGGVNEIQGGTGSDTFLLTPAGGGFDTIAGFSVFNEDVLGLQIALSATKWDGDSATLQNFVKVTSGGGDTNIAISPDAIVLATPIARLVGAGDLSFADLLEHHSLCTA